MSRPSARHVLPEFTERTSFGNRTINVMAQLMYLEHKDPDRDIALYVNSLGDSFSAMTAPHDAARTRATAGEMLVRHVREAVEYGLVDGIVPSRGTSAGSQGGR